MPTVGACSDRCCRSAIRVPRPSALRRASCRNGIRAPATRLAHKPRLRSTGNRGGRGGQCMWVSVCACGTPHGKSGCRKIFRSLIRAIAHSSPRAPKRGDRSLDNHVMREGARLASRALRAKISGRRGRMRRDICAIRPQAFGRPCKERPIAAKILVGKLLFGHRCISKSGKGGASPTKGPE